MHLSNSFFLRVLLIASTFLASTTSRAAPPPTLDPSLRPLLRQGEPSAQAIKAEIPKLRAWVQTHPADQLGRFLALSRLGQDFMQLQAGDSAYQVLHQARRAGSKLGGRYPLEQALVVQSLSSFFISQGRPDSVLHYNKLAAHKLTTAGYPLRQPAPVALADGQQMVVGEELALLAQDEGLVLARTGNMAGAVKALERSLAYERPLHNNMAIGAILRQLGLLHLRLEQFPEAGFYFNQTKALALQMPDAKLALRMLTGAITAHQYIIKTPAEARQLLTDVQFASQRQRPLQQAHPRDAEIIIMGARLALTEAHLQSIIRPAAWLPQQRPLRRADSLLTYARQIATPGELTEWEYYIGRTAQYIQQVRGPVAARPQAARLAQVYIDSLQNPAARSGLTIRLAKELNHTGQPQAVLELLRPLQGDIAGPEAPFRRRDMFRELQHAYVALNQYPAAYDALLHYEALEDSLRSSRQFAALNDLQVRYRTAQREQRIAQLTQQRRLAQHQAERQQSNIRLLLVAAAGLVLALVVFGVFYARLQRAQTLAQLATKAKDRLYSIIAHDLRGPLFAFTRLADIVDYYRHRGEMDALDTLTAEVRTSANQLTRLLDNLLHWAASETGELTPQPAVLPVPPLLQEVADLYAPAARVRQVEMQVAASSPELTALADRNMTRTILRNLVGNALNVAPDGSLIYLSAERLDGHVRLNVRDAGPGLTPEQVQTLLSATAGAAPKSGSSALSSRREHGTGLGLPLVRRLAALQGGQFSLSSQIGQGTTASITLPLGFEAG